MHALQLVGLVFLCRGSTDSLASNVGSSHVSSNAMHLHSGKSSFACLVSTAHDHLMGAGLTPWWKVVIGKLRAQFPAGMEGKSSFSELAFCADSYFGICLTAVACKRSSRSAKSAGGRLRLKTTYTLPMWLWIKWHCKLVHGWMVYIEIVPRQQQFDVAPAMQQPKQHHQYTTSMDIKNMCYKRIQSLIQNHLQHMCSESV